MSDTNPVPDVQASQEHDTGPRTEPVQHMADAADEPGLPPSVLFSSHQVIFVGWDEGNTRTTLAFPDELLIRLSKAWSNDDTGELTRCVRDLFDGQDGELQFLADLGLGSDA